MVATVWILSIAFVLAVATGVWGFVFLCGRLREHQHVIDDHRSEIGEMRQLLRNAGENEIRLYNKHRALEERVAKLEKPAEQPVPKQPVISKRWTESRDQLEGKPARKALRVEKAS